MSIEIVAGDSQEKISEFAESELKSSFCANAEDFKAEFPGENGVRYRVSVIIEPLE